MKFLRINEENRVTLVHNQPFDDKNGLKKTKEQLQIEGMLVNELPIKPESVIGKSTMLYANPLRWEYIDRPLTQAEKINQMVLDGTLTQEQANDLLN